MMSEVVRFSKLIIGSANAGAMWFVADEFTRQIVKMFQSELEAKAWLAQNKQEAREILDENITFFNALTPSPASK